jgi:hypothetical protein
MHLNIPTWCNTKKKLWIFRTGRECPQDLNRCHDTCCEISSASSYREVYCTSTSVTTHSITLWKMTNKQWYTRKVQKSFAISLLPPPSDCLERRVGGIHSGYLADGNSHGMQSAESGVERRTRQWKTTSTSTTKPSSA